MSYWDTSSLVKLYVQEADSATFENHILNSPTAAATSRIALYEARATFRRKEGDGALQAGAALALYNQLLRDVAAGQVRLIELVNGVEQEYGMVLDNCFQSVRSVPIRTLDAIHLASARVLGETEIVATDKRLRDAAKLLKFSLFPA
jgi:predicted nucleic acid-binding protein